MKVMLVNGSPHKYGCTNRALEEVARALEADGVEAEIFWIGAEPQGGCVACGACGKTGDCAFGEVVNEFRARAAEADGFVFGAPVHYAHAASSLLGFMDRLFYSNGRAGRPNVLAHKPAAAVASARRAGTTASLDDINKFFTISQMPIVSSFYWNNVHGATTSSGTRRACPSCASWATTWPGCSSASRRVVRRASSPWPSRVPGRTSSASDFALHGKARPGHLAADAPMVTLAMVVRRDRPTWQARTPRRSARAPLGS